MTIRINKKIPRTMTLEGLEYLGRMARSVPKNGLIVEVGPLFGSSTWVLAKNCDPSVRVISIDTWEPQPWIDKVEEKFPGCHPFSKDAFLHYTKDCPNVTAIQGYSPGIMGDFNETIDMFFDDATHGDPGFSESLSFYVPRVRPGGLLCGDDYAAGWPDIINRVNELGQKWGASPEIIGRVWSYIKPEGALSTKTVYDVVGPFDAQELTITTKLSGKSPVKGVPGAWAGAPHRAELLEELTIAPPEDSGLTGYLQIRDVRGQVSHWAPFGETLTTGAPISAVRAHLAGPESKVKVLSYQVCSVELAKRKTSNSRLYSDGAWSAGQDSADPICAIRCVVQDIKP